MIALVLPTLRIGGGALEAVRLGTSLSAHGIPVGILSLWKAPHEIDTRGLPVRYATRLKPERSTAARDYPAVLAGARRELARWAELRAVLFTHYPTLPVAALAPASARRYCYVQGLEWKFVQSSLRQLLLRAYLRRAYRRTRVITANTFIATALEAEGLTPFHRLSIWADAAFRGRRASPAERPLHCAMVLRRGTVKRLDLYNAFLTEADRAGDVRVGVITPDDDIAALVRRNSSVETCLVRPSTAEMVRLYESSRVFIGLSDTEGFGLPPLEAMGSGCVPLCRDCGGLRAYMHDALEPNVLPLELATGAVFGRARALWQGEARLHSLSRRAGEIFDAGLARRDSCVEELARLLE